MRALIGITSYVEEARWGVWTAPATLLPQRYVEAVHAGGGRALVIPPCADGADAVVAALDGLVLAGGSDVDPALYGAESDPHTEQARPLRDAGEQALLRAAMLADLPTLGICRGMQMMVVTNGGWLIQHLPDVVGSERHRAAPGQYAEHGVRTAEGTRLAALLGPSLTVPSYHHQGVADAGTLTVSAYADEDDTIEGVELPEARFALGV
ncbi:MAG: gamma-glutamyl-gamma-aminobutyrate hydrolase family protein, partial [Actinomycetota bacterium]|nr:gamma-glutamyl-gamma-aminobutyrate hydrolase family protein [Actinomycetota bacterium]